MVAYLNFQYKAWKGGNNSLSVGVVPESQSGDAGYLWKTTGAIGRYNSGGGSVLPQLPMPADQTITTLQVN